MAEVPSDAFDSSEETISVRQAKQTLAVSMVIESRQPRLIGPDKSPYQTSGILVSGTLTVLGASGAVSSRIDSVRWPERRTDRNLNSLRAPSRARRRQVDYWWSRSSSGEPLFRLLNGTNVIEISAIAFVANKWPQIKGTENYYFQESSSLGPFH
jgi:hypothetical protein